MSKRLNVRGNDYSDELDTGKEISYRFTRDQCTGGKKCRGEENTTDEKINHP